MQARSSDTYTGSFMGCAGRMCCAQTSNVEGSQPLADQRLRLSPLLFKPQRLHCRLQEAKQLFNISGYVA